MGKCFQKHVSTIYLIQRNRRQRMSGVQTKEYRNTTERRNQKQSYVQSRNRSATSLVKAVATSHRLIDREQCDVTGERYQGGTQSAVQIFTSAYVWFLFLRFIYFRFDAATGPEVLTIRVRLISFIIIVCRNCIETDNCLKASYPKHLYIFSIVEV